MRQFLFLAGLLAVGAIYLDSAPELDIDPTRITVSGISAGGAMAQQLHFAYPDLFSGAAVIAGPPYGCADGALATAFARCMTKVPGELPVAEFAASVRDAAEAAAIADPELLSDDRVWLFHGAEDTVIAAAVGDAAAALYAQFVQQENLVYIDDFAAAHHFPTIDQGHDCSASEPPYIGACGFDAAGALLRHLYPGLVEPGETAASAPLEVALAGAGEAGLSGIAWLYLPDACAGGKQSCALHLVLHGCGQSATQIGMTFIEQTGYLRWAEANGIVLAFPQVQATAGNPMGCWDWWGYTGPDYRVRDGAQMKVLASWVRALAGYDN